MEKEILDKNNYTHNIEIVKKYLNIWYTYRDSKMIEQEYALNSLFQNYYQNNNLQNILLKVSCLNDFYSTHIIDTFSVAKVIYEMNIDKMLFEGDLNLVNLMSDELRNKTNRREYVFATKYCSFHRPEIYPIYDSKNDKVLKEYKKDLNIEQVKLDENYFDYVKTINKYREIFGLESFSYKQIDRFNWTFANINNR